MIDRRTEASSILDASPHAARWARTINGCLFAIGASASAFVYFSGWAGKEVMHAGRTGEVQVESAESLLFSYPFFQLVLFLMPLIMDLNWRGFQSAFHRSEQFQRARDAKFKQLDSVFVYFCMCFALIGMEMVAFGMALVAAWWGYTHGSLRAG